MRHHTFCIEAEAEQGIRVAQEWVGKELGMELQQNPDIIVLRYSLFSVEDARRVYDLAGQAPFSGDTKVLVIAAARAYHEAQNALLKLFEEPPQGVYLFLILPSLGGLLPTLRSRVHILSTHVGFTKPYMGGEAEKFIQASKEKRSAMLKKLASGRDEEERRGHREEAIALVSGIEAVAYLHVGFTKPYMKELLSDIAVLRGYLYDRSAPVKMILEHLALVTPKDLL